MGDVCHPTKKVGTVIPHVSTYTNSPTATKVTAPVPMEVSQMGSSISKPETVEQQSDSYQYEQDQECDGDELFAVKGKGQASFKGTCFKCGMRGHEADRARGDLEIGEGGSQGKGWHKGKWSNSG